MTVLVVDLWIDLDIIKSTCYLPSSVYCSLCYVILHNCVNYFQLSLYVKYRQLYFTLTITLFSNDSLIFSYFNFLSSTKCKTLVTLSYRG